MSDSDSIDSPTYDGDIESSTTAGIDALPPSKMSHHHHSSSTSTLNTPSLSAFSESSTTPVVDSANPFIRSTKADTNHPVFLTQPINTSATPLYVPEEPAVSAPSESAFNPAALTPDDIQAFVRKAIEGEDWRQYKINPPPSDRPVRVYADGLSGSS